MPSTPDHWDPASAPGRDPRSADGDGDALDAEEFFEARSAAFLAHPTDPDAAEGAMCREVRRPIDTKMARPLRHAVYRVQETRASSRMRLSWSLAEGA